jgi:FCP1-like phosphatase family protein
VNKILEAKKLFLLLDIDNTILHASSIPLSVTTFEDLKKNYGNDVFMIKLGQQRMIVKLRPLIRELFESLRDKFEIYFYTYGTQEYATAVITYLRETFGFDFLSTERLVARDSNGEFSHKSIKRIFPTTEDMVLILDDRVDVWQGAKNLIRVSGYYFFREKDFPMETEHIMVDTDRSLYSVEKLITFIHAAFYWYYEHKGSRKDVKEIMQGKLHSVFNDKKFVFSGMYNKNQLLIETQQGYVIDMLGGDLEAEYSDDIDFVISEKYEGIYLLIKDTTKMKQATESGKPIVHKLWLDYCYFLFGEINKEDFILTKESPELVTGSMTQVSLLEKNKESIDNFYSTVNVSQFYEYLNKKEQEFEAMDF